MTAIYGPGFVLHEPEGRTPRCRFVCFTDRDLRSKRWEIVRQSHADLSSRRANRHVKTLVHRYVQGPTLYLDAEFKIVGNARRVFKNALQNGPLAATAHPVRDCLFSEAEFCLRRKRIESPDALREQVKRYRAAGMPPHWGLWAGNIIARRGDLESARIGEAWWAEIERGSERDQVSLPFVAWSLGMRPVTIPGHYAKLPTIARRKQPKRRYM